MSLTTDIKFPIEIFFPKEDYKTRCTKEKKLVPIYLTALDQPFENIKKSINTDNCNYQEKTYGLSLLTVAVIVRRHDIVSFLLIEMKVAPDPKDFANRIPLHYACLINDTESMKLLQEASKVEKVILNRFEIFPGWKQVLQPQFPKKDEIVGYKAEKDGKIVSMTSQEFSDLTQGSQFYDGVVSDEKSFVNLFSNALLAAPNNNKNERALSSPSEKFASLIPPNLCLAKQGKANYGVTALQKIKAGDLCGVYGGEISNDLNPYTIGSFSDNIIVSGKKIRNFVTMINDGFPNVAISQFALPDGRISFGLVALENIEPGDALLWNYGPSHPVKALAREEIGIKKIESFFSKNSFRTLLFRLSKLNHPENSEKKAQEFRLIKTRLLYALHTPSLVNYLFIKGIVSLDDVALISQKEFFHMVDENDRLHATYSVNLICYERINDLVKSCKDQKTISSFRKQFGELALTYSRESILSIFPCLLLIKDLSGVLDSKENLETIMKFGDILSIYKKLNEIDLQAYMTVKQAFYKLPKEMIASFILGNYGEPKFQELLKRIEKLEPKSN